MGAVIVYTFVFHMLSPPKELTCSNGALESHSLTVKLLEDEENPDQESDFTSEKGKMWKSKVCKLAISK